MTADVRGMLVIHRTVRAELAELPDLLRAAAGSPARAALVAAHAHEVLALLHTHHEGEDQLLWPVLVARAPLDEPLVARMAAQHARLASSVEAIDASLDGWVTTADAATGERLAAATAAALDVLAEHIDDEETHVLPLAAEHLEQHEWDGLAAHGFAGIAADRRAVALARLLAHAGEDERVTLLSKVPPPLAAAWHATGRDQHSTERAARAP